MFHSANLQMLQRTRRPNALRTYFGPSAIVPGREPFRRGLLYSTVTAVLLVVGAVLTWLSFNNIFGARTSMTGPLLIALSLGLSFCSLRQFIIARKQRRRATREQIRFQTLSREAVAAMVINRQDGIGAVTVILDTLDMSSEASWRSAPSVEYAPPSYSEALQQTRSPTTPSSSSSVLRQTQQAPLSPPERDSEPPPSYDEAVAALHYHHDHHDALSTAPCPQYTDSVTHEHLNAAPSAEQTQTQFSPLTIHSQQHSIYYNSNKEDTIVLPTVTG